MVILLIKNLTVVRVWTNIIVVKVFNLKYKRFGLLSNLHRGFFLKHDKTSFVVGCARLWVLMWCLINN